MLADTPQPAHEAEPKPLPARSVILSLLLGHHPASVTSASLARAAEYFGIPASTVRVALTRAVAAGELRRDGREYVLGEHLLRRQRHQDEAIEPDEVPWDGRWVMAVVVVGGRSRADRAALRDILAADRLAELREGVWLRPANLRRVPGHRGDPVLNTFVTTPDGDAAELAARLWDLTAWSERGRALLAGMEHVTEPAARLSTAAQLVRHLAADPILPPALLPEDWPGPRLRSVYADYQDELRRLATR